MKHNAWKIFLSKLTVFLLVGFSLSSFCLLEVSSQRRGTSAQRRKSVQRSGKVYNNFVHNIPGHRESCNSCHKTPTGLSSAETLTGEDYKYPDITDYPDHDSCINCHRQQFFRGARPAICSICHTKVSPRDKVRFAFPRANQGQEFRVRFPHNIHQDIIAGLETPSRREGTEAAHFINARFAFAPSVADDKDKRKTDYNNCTICHYPAAAKTYTTTPRRPQLVALEEGVVTSAHREKITTSQGYFETLPNGHDSCFNCHYSEQQPIRTNCAGCHISRGGSSVESSVIERTSLKYSHYQLSKTDQEEQAKAAGSNEPKKEYENKHERDCASCHVRITQSFEVRTLKPDVPIFSCGSCHSKEIKAEIQQRNDDLEEKKKNPQYEIKSCLFCHNTYIGLFQTPKSHRDIK